MIISVKPFGHLHCGDIGLGILTSSCHREVNLSINQTVGISIISLGDGAEHHRGVQHQIVECEIVARDYIDARRRLQIPVTDGQIVRYGDQVVVPNFPRPERFTRFFPFTFDPQTGKTKIG